MATPPLNRLSVEDSGTVTGGAALSDRGPPSSRDLPGDMVAAPPPNIPAARTGLTPHNGRRSRARVRGPDPPRPRGSGQLAACSEPQRCTDASDQAGSGGPSLSAHLAGQRRPLLAPRRSGRGFLGATMSRLADDVTRCDDGRHRGWTVDPTRRGLPRGQPHDRAGLRRTTRATPRRAPPPQVEPYPLTARSRPIGFRVTRFQSFLVCYTARPSFIDDRDAH